ncbi:MAG: tetratricopeptide repeat protein [Porphyromonadaceae bacterium]|nr:tetratricopeptide repeat protein [Porphyromonadaceae bacterium]
MPPLYQYLRHLAWLFIFVGTVLSSCNSIDSPADDIEAQIRREILGLASLEPELAQYPNIDSAQLYLINLLDKAKILDDTYLETIVLYKLGCNYAYHMDLGKSDSCFWRLIDLTPSARDSAKVAHAYANLGSNELRRGNSEAAIGLYKEAEACALRTGIKSEISALIWTNMGMAYSTLDKQAEALDYLNKALASVRESEDTSKNKRLEGGILQAMGNSFFVQEDLDRAYTFFTAADKAHMKHKQEKEALAARSNRATVLQDMHRYPEALALNQECEALAKKIGYTHLLGILYTNRGRIYLAMRDYKNSRLALDEAERIRREKEDFSGLAQVYSSQMDLAMALADPELAHRYGMQALELARQTDNKVLQMDVWSTLADISARAGQYTEAIDALKEQIALKDSLFTEEKYKALQEVAIKHKTAQKDAELKQAYSELEIGRLHRTLLVSFIVLLLLILGFAVWVRRRTLRQQRALVLANNQLAEMINRNLTPTGAQDSRTQVAEITDGSLEDTPKEASDNLEEASTDASDALLARLKACMEQEKAYLSPGLSLEILAQKVATNRTYLSHILNHRIGRAFTDYVNFYRVEEAKHRLATTNDKIGVIAMECGFGCTQTFYAAFKKSEQMSPNEYRKVIREMSHH